MKCKLLQNLSYPYPSYPNSNSSVIYIYIHILIKYRVEIIGVNINTTDVRKSTAFTDEKQMPDGQYVRRSTNI